MSIRWYTLANIVTSFSTNGNFIPQAGTMTLSGQTIGADTIQFDADTPSTGAVQVSINGNRFLGYKLFQTQQVAHPPNGRTTRLP